MKNLRYILITIILVFLCWVPLKSQISQVYCSGGTCNPLIVASTGGNQIAIATTGSNSTIINTGGNLTLGAGASSLWTFSGSTGGLSAIGNYTITPGGYATATNCTTSACGAATGGATIISSAGTGVTINTTNVTANSEIIVTRDNSLSARLGTTCNTQTTAVLGEARVVLRTAATSFVVALDVAPTINPICFDWFIVN